MFIENMEGGIFHAGARAVLSPFTCFALNRPIQNKVAPRVSTWPCPFRCIIATNIDIQQNCMGG